MKKLNRLNRYDIDDVLDLVGLARRRHWTFVTLFSAAAMLGIGAAVGAGVGLAFAPSSGRRLREDVGERFGRVRDQVKREWRHQIGTNAA